MAGKVRDAIQFNGPVSAQDDPFAQPAAAAQEAEQKAAQQEGCQPRLAHLLHSLLRASTGVSAAVGSRFGACPAAQSEIGKGRASRSEQSAKFAEI
jgi:hypothetical protein